MKFTGLQHVNHWYFKDPVDCSQEYIPQRKRFHVTEMPPYLFLKKLLNI